MSNTLTYKEFSGSINFSARDCVFYGRVEAIPDLVTVEGSSVEELKNSFHEAVDDYLNILESQSRDLHND